jgi:hypothetical protein
MAKNPNGTLFHQPALHQQSFDIQLQNNRPVHIIQPVPPPRTDGIWGDLMQLTQPNVNHPSPPSVSFLGSPSLNSSHSSSMAHPSSYQPLTSTTPATNMSGLEVGMGRLMNGPPTAPSTNPFSSLNYASNNAHGFQPGAMAVHSQLHHPASYQAASPFTVAHPTQHAGNPFFAHQTTLTAPSSSSSATFANGLAPNRNPFLSTNSHPQAFPPHSNGFSNCYPASSAPSSSSAHQQQSQLSINQHSPFFN